MLLRCFPAVAAALLLAACSSTVPHGVAPGSPAGLATGSRPDSAALRALAQATLDEFAARAAAAGADSAPAPRARVRNTPFLIFFRADSNLVVLPRWEDLDAEPRGLFTTFAGGDAVLGEQLFRALFNRFFVAHEAAHWLQHRTSRPGGYYASEEEANRIAVAYWRTAPDGEAFLAALEQTLESVVSRVPDPTPAGEAPETYFEEHYLELGRDPMKYGYYQFRFVLDATRSRDRLDFADLVREVSAR